jgi:hypothetical protein
MSSVYDSDDAVYGVGVFGSASYGIASPTVSIGGVFASFDIGDALAEGGTGATVPLTGYTLTLNLGDTTQTADALFVAAGNALTITLGQAEVKTINRIDLVGVSASFAVGVLQPNLTTFVTGFSLSIPLGTVDTFGGTGDSTTAPHLPLQIQLNDDVTVTGGATFVPTGYNLTFVTNNVTPTGVILNFLPFANDFSRKRTVYLPKADTRGDRTARTEERY